MISSTNCWIWVYRGEVESISKSSKLLSSYRKPISRVCLTPLHSSTNELMSIIPTPFSFWSDLIISAISSNSSSNYRPFISSLSRVSKTSFMIMLAFSEGAEEVLLSSDYFFYTLLIFSISFIQSSSF